MAAPSWPSWACCLLLERTPLYPLFPMPPAHPTSPVCGGGLSPLRGGPEAAGGNPPWHHPPVLSPWRGMQGVTAPAPRELAAGTLDAPNRHGLVLGNRSLLSPFHLLLPSRGRINSLTASAAAKGGYRAAPPPQHPAAAPGAPGGDSSGFAWGHVPTTVCGLQELESRDLGGLWKGRGGVLLSTSCSFGKEEEKQC